MRDDLVAAVPIEGDVLRILGAQAHAQRLRIAERHGVNFLQQPPAQAAAGMRAAHAEHVQVVMEAGKRLPLPDLAQRLVSRPCRRAEDLPHGLAEGRELRRNGALAGRRDRRDRHGATFILDAENGFPAQDPRRNEDVNQFPQASVVARAGISHGVRHDRVVVERVAEGSDRLANPLRGETGRDGSVNSYARICHQTPRGSRETPQQQRGG